MAFEVGGLERHIGVAGGVGFVEGIRCETDHIIVDFVGDSLRYAVLDAAVAFLARFVAAVDKMLALRLHDLELFLAHGAAHVIGLTKAEARQLAADLHDLLLINDDAVGHIDDVRHLGGLVGDLVRLAAVAQIGGDGIHRTRAVERDQGDDIFEVFGAHTDQHLRHTRGFKLEDALGFALGKHGVGGGVVVVDVRHTELRFAAAHGGFGIVDDGQRAQTEEVHLQKPQTLDLHHIELGHGQAVVGGKRHIFGGWFAGDDNARGVGGGVAGHPLDF